MMSQITLAEAQQQVDHWIQTVGVRYFSELTNMAMLTEEVGELSRLLIREYGEQSWKEGEKPRDVREGIAEELADISFVVFCLADQCGIDLQDAFDRKLKLKTERDRDRHGQNTKLD